MYQGAGKTWNNKLSINYMQNKIEDEDLVKQRMRQQQQLQQGSVVPIKLKNNDENETTPIEQKQQEKQDRDESTTSSSQPSTATETASSSQRPQEIEQASRYKIIRRIPGYTLGDTLKKGRYDIMSFT